MATLKVNEILPCIESLENMSVKQDKNDKHGTVDSRSNGSAYNKNPLSNNIFICPNRTFSFNNI